MIVIWYLYHLFGGSVERKKIMIVIYLYHLFFGQLNVRK